MKINKVLLTDFANIGEAEFDFTGNPTVLITGDNGSGKSSVLKALALALTNTSDGNLEDYIRWGAKGFSIIVQFIHLGVEYTVSVTCVKVGKSVTTSRKLAWWPGGDESADRQELHNSDVTQHLEELLAASQCQYTVFSSQGNLDLVYATPAVRRGLLQRVYSLDFAEELEVVNGSISHGTQELMELAVKKSSAEGQLEGLREQELLPVSARSPEVMTADIERITLVYEQSVAHQRQLEDVTAEKQEVGMRLQRVEKETAELEIKLKSLTTAATEIEAYGEERDQACAEEVKALREQRQIPTRLRAFDVVACDEQVVELTAEVRRMTAEAEQHRRQVQVLSGFCSACNRAMPEAQPEKAAEVQALLDKTTQNCLALEHTITELRAAKEKYLAAEKQVLQVEAANAKLEKREQDLMLALIKDLETRRKDIADLPATLALTAERRQAGAELRQQLDALRLREDELIAIWSEPAGSVLLNDIKLLTAERQAALDIRAKNEVIAKINEDTLVKRAEITKVLGEYRGIQLVGEREVSEWQAVKALLQTQLPSFMLVRLLQLLEAQANRFLGRAYHGRYQIKLQETTRGGIELCYGTDGVWKEASLASGAEKSLINLSLKLGFTQLSGLSILILDEVDAYFSDDVATAVFDLLTEETVAKTVDQIFVISHKEGLKEQLGNIGAQVFTMDCGVMTEET